MSTTRSDHPNAYARLTNPKWADYRPELPAGTPEFDARLLDMLENLLVEGSVEIHRTFNSSAHQWQIAYRRESPNLMMSGGGASVRDALASLAGSMAERGLAR